MMAPTEIPVDIRQDTRKYHDQCFDSLRRGHNSTRSIVSETNCSGMLNPDDPWYDSMTQKIDEQRKKWEEEIEKKRNEFFKLDTIDSSVRLPTTNSANFSLDQSKAGYERGSDGRVHFRLRFDVRNFSPQDLRVSILDDKKLKVIAKHQSKTSKSANTREFSRTINLPKNIDDTKITSSLSSDGVLLIDSPILSEEEMRKSQSLSPSTSVISSPSSNSEVDSIRNSNPLFPTKGVIFRDQRFSLEVQMGSDYQPNEIDVRTQNQKVYIHARHEEKSQMKSILKEFIKEYDLPSHVDPQNVRAKLEGGILFLEASINS